MHDATECGVLGGLYEMASHSKVGLNIHINEIVIQDSVKKTCKCFGIDPYISISEGTLLASASKKSAKDVVEALKKEGIPASIVGEAVPKKEGIHVFEKDRKYKLTHPKEDPFWGKFEEYLKK
jgi:hydrogenase expression/formation protein HypE